MWRFALLVLCVGLCVTQTYSKCMNWCSKHGICTDPGDAGYCICDTGYTGADCSKRMCPKAFDPLTLDQYPARRAIRLSTGHEGGVMGGKVKLTFASESIYLNADALSLSSEACTTAVSQFHGVGDVSCVRDYLDSTALTGSYVITFNSWSVLPQENNLFNHSGNPPLDVFKCDVAKVDDFNAKKPYCEVTDVVTEDIPVYSVCANHGECDIRTGQCKCERGFYGAACSDTTDDKDEQVIAHDGPYFSGTVLKTIAYRNPSDSFNLFKASIAHDVSDVEKVVTTISGASVLHHRGAAQIDGLTAISTGMAAYMRGNTTLLQLTADAPESPDQHCALTMIRSSLRNTCPAQKHIEFLTDGAEVFDVAADGSIFALGSVRAANGTLIAENGLLTTQNVNILNSLDVFGSVNIEDSVTIGSGFALTPEGMTIDTDKHSGSLLELRSSQAAFDGSILDIQCASRNASVIRSTNSDGVVTFDVTADGHMTTSALRMHSGGVEVDAGGVDIKSGGLSVHGGLTVASGALIVESQDIRMHKLALENSATADTLLSLSNSADVYVGSALQIKLESKSSDGTFLEGMLGGESVLQLSAQGIHTSGGITAKDATVTGHASFNSIALSRCVVSAADRIDISAECGGYVDISPDGRSAPNVLNLPNEDVAAGSFLLIRNQDGDATSGDLIIPSQSTVLAVYDGIRWNDVHALHAPIRELRDIQSLQLSNDVSLGNFTVSMGDLQLMSLPRGAVAYGGAAGTVKGRSEFSYNKGVLSVPALRVDNLIKDINANNKTISNVQLRDVELMNARIAASSITLSTDCAGVAYIDASQTLQCSRDVSVRSDGSLLITHLNSDLNVQQHNINNISSLGAENITVASMQASSITLVDAHSGIALIGPSGDMSSSAAITIDGDIVSLLKLASYEQVGDVDFADHIMKRLHIEGGSISNISDFSSHGITISGLATQSSSAALRGLSVLSDGTIVADDGSFVTHFGELTVSTLSVENPLDMKGQVIRDAVLENISIVGTLPRVATDNLHLSTTKTSDKGQLLLLDVEGNVLPASGLSVDDTGFTAQTATVNHMKISGDLALPNVPASSVLGVDADGRVIGLSDANLHSLDVGKIAVTQTAVMSDLRLPDVAVSSVLGTDAEGRVSAATSVKFDTVSAGGVSAASVKTSSLSLTGGSTGGVLTVSDGSGKVEASQYLAIAGVKVDSIETSTVSAVNINLPTFKSAAVLGTDANGHVVARDSLKLHEVHADNSIIADIDVTSSLKLSNHASGIMRVASDGSVTSGQDIEVASFSANSAGANSVTVASELHLPFLSSGLLEVSASGDVRSSVDVAVRSVAVSDSATVAGELSVASLRLTSESSDGVITVDKDGYIRASNRLSGSEISSQLLVAASAEISNLKLPSTEAGVLVASDTGTVSSSQVIEVSSITASRVTSDEITTKQLYIPSSKAGILVTDDAGAVRANDVISVKELQADSITASAASFESLRLNGSAGGILSVSNEGQVGSTNDISVDSAVLHSLSVSGAATLSSVTIPSLASNAAQQVIVSVNSDGSLSAGGAVSTHSLSSHDILVSILSADDITLPRHSSGMLSVDENGKVFSTNDLRVGGVAASSLTTSTATIGQIILTSGTKNGVLIVGDDNKLTTTSSINVAEMSLSSMHADEVNSKQFRLSGASGSGLIVSDDEGVFSVAGADLLVPHTQFASVSVAAEAVLHNLLLPEVTAGHVLTTDASGFVSSTASVALDQIDVKSLKSGRATFEELILSHPAGVLMINEDNVVSSTMNVVASSVSAEALKSATIFADDIVLTSDNAVTTGSAVVRDASGHLRTSKQLTVSSVSAESITTDRLVLPGIQSGSLLIVSEDGAIKSTSSLTARDLSADSITASASVVTPSLTISGAKISDVYTNLLSINSAGKVQVASDPIAVNTITTIEISSENMKTGHMTFTTITSSVLGVDADGRVIGLSDAKLHSLDVGKIAVKQTAVMSDLRLPDVAVSSVLGTDAEGRVSAATSVKFDTVSAEGVSAASVQTSSLSLTGGGTGGVLTVSEGSGKVEASTHLVIDSVSSSQVDISGGLSSNSLRVTSLSSDSSAAGSRLLVAAADGSVSVLSDSDKVATMSSLLPESATFKSVIVSNSFSAASISVHEREAMGSGMIIGSVSGKLQPVAHATVSDLTVSGAAKIDSIDANSINLLSASPSSLLYVDATGALRSSRVVIDNKVGSLTVPELIVNKMASDIDMDGHKVRNAIVEASSIQAPEVRLLMESSTEEGTLVLQRKGDKKLVPTSALSVSATGELLTSIITSARSDTPLRIKNADISHSAITSASSISAEDISTTTLSTSAAASIGGDLDVDGTIRAKGNVIGSGSYVDSSDSRYKRNIANLTSATQIVNALQAVTYEYRIDEFPAKGFESSAQLGWIAQEVQAVAPELVHTDEDGYLSVAYGRSAAVIAQAVKETNQAVETLEEKMERRIAQLEKALGAALEEIERLKNIVEK